MMINEKFISNTETDIRGKDNGSEYAFEFEYRCPDRLMTDDALVAVLARTASVFLSAGFFCRPLSMGFTPGYTDIMMKRYRTLKGAVSVRAEDGGVNARYWVKRICDAMAQAAAGFNDRRIIRLRYQKDGSYAVMLDDRMSAKPCESPDMVEMKWLSLSGSERKRIDGMSASEKAEMFCRVFSHSWNGTAGKPYGISQPFMVKKQCVYNGHIEAYIDCANSGCTVSEVNIDRNDSGEFVICCIFGVDPIRSNMETDIDRRYFTVVFTGVDVYDQYVTFNAESTGLLLEHVDPDSADIVHEIVEFTGLPRKTIVRHLAEAVGKVMPEKAELIMKGC